MFPQLKLRIEELEKEKSTLQHQKEMLQEYHQKQKTRADNLELQRKSLQEALANLTDAEVTFKQFILGTTLLNSNFLSDKSQEKVRNSAEILEATLPAANGECGGQKAARISSTAGQIGGEPEGRGTRA